MVEFFTFCDILFPIKGLLTRKPLIYDSAKAFPFRINWIPLVNLLDYPEMRDILINVIGNTTMFIPIGVVWPIVYKELNTHKKIISAGIGFSLCIEILQLPFYDRVTDVDDLLLNSLGFIIGYLLYLHNLFSLPFL